MNPKFQKELERRLRQVEVPPPPAGLSQMLKSDIPADLKIERRETPVRFWSIWGLSWQYGSAVVMVVALSYVTLRLMQSTGLPESVEFRSRIPVRAAAPASAPTGAEAETSAANAVDAEAPQAAGDAVGQKSPTFADAPKVATLRESGNAVSKLSDEKQRGDQHQGVAGRIAGSLDKRDLAAKSPPPPPPATFAPELQVADRNEQAAAVAQAAPSPRQATGLEMKDADGRANGGVSSVTASAPAVAAKPQVPSTPERRLEAGRMAPAGSVRPRNEASSTVIVDLFESPMHRGETVARILIPEGVELDSLTSGGNGPVTRAKANATTSDQMKKEVATKGERARFMVFSGKAKSLPTLEFKSDGNKNVVRNLATERVERWESAPLEMRREFLTSELERILKASPMDRTELAKLAKLTSDLAEVSGDRATLRLRNLVADALEASKKR